MDANTVREMDSDRTAGFLKVFSVLSAPLCPCGERLNAVRLLPANCQYPWL